MAFASQIIDEKKGLLKQRHVNVQLAFTGSNTSFEIPPIAFPVKKVRANIAYLVGRNQPCLYLLTTDMLPYTPLIGTISKFVWDNGTTFFHLQGIDDRQSMSFVCKDPITVGGTYNLWVNDVSGSAATVFADNKILLHFEFYG